MKLKIVDCLDQEFEPFIIRAINFYSIELFKSKRLLSRLDLTIQFKKYKPEEDDIGCTMVSGLNKSNKPRKFKIILRAGLGAAATLKCIAHEMVHVKQFALGELSLDGTKWKKETVPTDVDYYYEPCEIEAYGLEVGLWKKFLLREELWNVFKGVQNYNDTMDFKKILWKK